MSAAVERRGFLRGLVSLPMIGGGVTLLGAPTSAAVPVTEDLLDAYSQWLFNERRVLNFERYGSAKAREQGRFVPCTPAETFHFPVHPCWSACLELPQPSTRAALVLSAVGCVWRP